MMTTAAGHIRRLPRTLVISSRSSRGRIITRTGEVLGQQQQQQQHCGGFATTTTTAPSSSLSSRRRGLRVVALLGPPGSGKGFYGKRIAQALEWTPVTVSTILRQHLAANAASSSTTTSTTTTSHKMQSGDLVDDRLVCDVVGSYLVEEHKDNNGVVVLLDGFPRTLRQMELMRDMWQTRGVEITAALHLDIPDAVCHAKLRGRRSCQLCGRDWNVTTVRQQQQQQQQDGFDLPALLPDPPCTTCHSPPPPPAVGGDDPLLDWGVSMVDPQQIPSCWTQRADDTDVAILDKRLRIYRQQSEAPLLEYFSSSCHHSHQLLSLTPRRGVHDLPRLLNQVRVWWWQQQQQHNNNNKEPASSSLQQQQQQLPEKPSPPFATLSSSSFVPSSPSS